MNVGKAEESISCPSINLTVMKALIDMLKLLMTQIKPGSDGCCNCKNEYG